MAKSRHERSRLFIIRIVFLAALIVVLLSDHSFVQGGFVDVACEILGFSLLLLCAMGRAWSLLYAANYKNKLVLDMGPYSMVRHPLYVSSFIGSIGFGLASENFVALTIIVLATLVAYFPVVRDEEDKLIEKFGDAYEEYKRRVPQLIPNFAGYMVPEVYAVNTRAYRKALFESMGIVAAYMLLQGIEGFHEAGILPVLFRV